MEERTKMVSTDEVVGRVLFPDEGAAFLGSGSAPEAPDRAPITGNGVRNNTRHGSNEKVLGRVTAASTEGMVER